MTYISILTWNGINYLPKLFENLANLEYPSDKIKIVVTDSGSTDGSVEFLEDKLKQGIIHKFIKLEKNYGFAGGSNFGMQYAIEHNAEHVLLAGQDILLEPDALQNLINVAQNDNNIGIVQPLILHAKNKQEINSWGNEIHFLGYGWAGGNHSDISDYHNSDVKEITYSSGACVLYTGEMLKQVGVFDPNYFSYHEDSDICLRARMKNFKTVIAPKARVCHDEKFPTKKNKKRYFWMEKNRLYLIFKFYKISTLLLIAPMNFVMGLGQFIFAAKNGFIWQFINSRLWCVVNLRKIFIARKNIQNNRILTDKQLTQNFKAEIKHQDVSNFLLDKIGNPIMRVYWSLVKLIIR